MQRKWWQESVVYQIYCRSFYDSDGDGIGDLPGVLSKLPYLKELGINCIWFTPIYTSPQVDNGYDVADYRNIDPMYGTLEDFKHLLAEAHKLGIRIIIDMVLNHSSDQHKWFVESRKSRNNPYRDYYIWRDPKPDGSEPNNWGNAFLEGKGSAWEWDEQTGQYYLHNYSRHMPDLNWEHEPLRRKIYDMMRFWLDMGVDGFRLDVITMIKKPAGLPDYPGELSGNGYACSLEARAQRCNVPGIHDFLQEMHREVFSHYDMMTVGEASRITAELAPDYVRADRKELDSLYHFDICRRLPLPPTVVDIKKAYARWAQVVENNCWIAQYLTNHDFPRQVSRFGDDTQYRTESAKLLATLIHTLPGSPYVYQGEEIGMTNVEFPNWEDYNDISIRSRRASMIAAGKSEQEIRAELCPLSRDNSRTPFQWDASENAGFTKGTPWLKLNPRYPEINLEADKASANSIFAYYQKLIAMRKNNPAILDGRFRLLLPEHERIVMYLRTCTQQTLLVVANFSGEALELPVPEEVAAHTWQPLLYNYEDSDPLVSKTLRPWEAVLYEQTE